MNQELSEQIIDAALEVHRILGGPGLMENIYEVALCHELSLRGIKSERQVPIPVKYKNAEVRDPLFLDILVENDFIIEVKATGKDYPFYEVQLLTYLRLMNIKKGLIINFGKDRLMDGVSHITNSRENLAPLA